MSTRIRYKEVAPGVFVSVQKFLTPDGLLLSAYINTSFKAVTLVAEGADSASFQASYTSMHSAKLLLKKQLKAMGVVFTDEVRRKKES